MDTPPESSSETTGCPGLLPYDKDRDLFDGSIQNDLNVGGSGSCGSSANVCTNAGGTTCAACCDYSQGDCQFYNGVFSITQDEVDYPICCTETSPDDTCSTQNGIDPKNNAMAYIPDWW